jgi:hypothetical protein
MEKSEAEKRHWRESRKNASVSVVDLKRLIKALQLVVAKRKALQNRTRQRRWRDALKKHARHSEPESSASFQRLVDERDRSEEPHPTLTFYADSTIQDDRTSGR